MLACTALVGCTSDDVVENNEQTLEKGKAYVAVDIKTFNPSSRTANDFYEDGIDAENAVTNARFYFFNSDGTAWSANNQGTNYVEASLSLSNKTDDDIPSEETTRPGNIEEESTAVLVIQNNTGTLPQSIVAVLNAPTYLENTSKSLSELKSAIGNIEEIGATTSGNFVMTNSVYKNKLNEVATEVMLAPENICDNDGSGDKNGALDHPVSIYVERVVAKVRLQDPTSTNNLPTGSSFTPVGNNTETAIYAKINGWGIANNVDKSYLFKNISTNWDDTSLGFTWNDIPYFRSYWATTATGAANTNANSWSSLDDFNDKYCFENTSGSILPTEVLVSATLVDQDENPIEIAEWFTQQYTVAGLKAKVAESLNQKLFTKDGSTLTAIPTEAIDFVATSPEDEQNGYESYEAKAIIASTFKDTKWHNIDGTELTATQVNDIMATVQPAKIWKSGQTYYRAKIRHLANNSEDPGYYGVVRNHLYKIQVTGVSGLGTPVYNPDKIIIPTDDDSDKSFVAAQIYILSWRVVANDNVILE